MTLRRFRWRLHRVYGGHWLPAEFDTPADAGRWRAEHIPATGAPLTLIAVVDGEERDATTTEWVACALAWLPSPTRTRVAA